MKCLQGCRMKMLCWFMGLLADLLALLGYRWDSIFLSSSSVPDFQECC